MGQALLVAADPSPADEGVMNPFYYITHVRNLPSILERGILSHEQVEATGLPRERIYDEQIVERRRRRVTPAGRSLTSYANLFLQPRNAMLYRVLCAQALEDIAIVQVRPDVRQRDGVFVSVGNAASEASSMHPASEYGTILAGLANELRREYWKEEDGSRRKMMAECLVPDLVPPSYLQDVLVGNDRAKKVVEGLIGGALPVVVQRYQFFQPIHKQSLTTTLALVDGDLFFSHKQTLTVSVNCVGIMGKGLASRAKYQFPDLYVYYQDLCKARKLRLGRPYLYKPETSLYVQLADDWNPQHSVRPTQFLLFPTKHHWRDRSDLDSISRGLDWLLENYERENVESLAIPALGCGLGGLSWEDVGPIMCQRLARIRVPVWVYLPAESKVRKEHLSADYLLR